MKFFEERIGNLPWSLQRLWEKRVFQEQSFAIVAPTGVGKTTFGAIMTNFLITTNMFLAQNFDVLKGKRFEFIFVDDTDSLLKSGKNVDKVLRLLGFSQSQIELALKNPPLDCSENVAVLVMPSATLNLKRTTLYCSESFREERSSSSKVSSKKYTRLCLTTPLPC